MSGMELSHLDAASCEAQNAKNQKTKTKRGTSEVVAWAPQLTWLDIQEKFPFWW